MIYKLGVISRNTNTFTVNLFISLATFFPQFAGENLLQQLFFSLKALSTPVLLLHTFNRLVCDQSLIVANTVYKEIFTPVLFSPSLPAGKFKTGQIPYYLSLKTTLSGRIEDGVKLLASVDEQKLHGVKITMKITMYTVFLAHKLKLS